MYQCACRKMCYSRIQAVVCPFLVPVEYVDHGVGDLLLGEHPRLGVPLDLAAHLGDALVPTLHVIIGSLAPVMTKYGHLQFTLTP